MGIQKKISNKKDRSSKLVLITGASGFLGSHLTELFIKAGYKVRAFVRRTSKTNFLEHDNVKIIYGDMKDHLSLSQAVRGVNIIIHAASAMDGSLEEFRKVTVEGTHALLTSADNAGVRRFVYISSIQVLKMQKHYDNSLVAENAPYEDSPYFRNSYVIAKQEAEQLVLEFAQRCKMEIVVLRPGILYGPRCNWNISRLGFRIGRKFFIIGNGQYRIPVCYVRNCAIAVLIAAERSQVNPGPFNVVDDDRFTQIEYLRLIQKKAMPTLKIILMPYTIARVLVWLGSIIGRLFHLRFPIQPSQIISCHRRLEYSNTKARTILGWRPLVPKEIALEETMNFYANQKCISRRANFRVVGKFQDGKYPLKTCIIGCGNIAEQHMKILAKMKNVEVKGICDKNQKASAVFANRFGVSHSYTNAEVMLHNEIPDVVHVLTPPQSHAYYSELSIAKGCHVIVEKPIALNASEARRMADLAAKRGKHLCVDYNHLYDPIMIKARALIESGSLGDLIWVDSYYGVNLSCNPQERYQRIGKEMHWAFQLPGGLYQNFASHPIYLALEFLGRPTEVSAHARWKRVLSNMPTDELRILLKTKEASGLVTISFAASPRLHYLYMLGTKGALFVDLWNKWVVPFLSIRGVPQSAAQLIMNFRHAGTIYLGTARRILGKVLDKPWTTYEGMEVLVREFYGALQEDREPPVKMEEAIAVMEIMDRTWKLIGDEAIFWPEDRKSSSRTEKKNTASFDTV